MSLQCHSGSDFRRLAKTNFDLALAHASAIREFFADHFALAEKARLNLRMSKAEKLTGKFSAAGRIKTLLSMTFAMSSSVLVFSYDREKEVIESITRMALLRLLMCSRGTERRSRIK